MENSSVEWLEPSKDPKFLRSAREGLTSTYPRLKAEVPGHIYSLCFGPHTWEQQPKYLFLHSHTPTHTYIKVLSKSSVRKAILFFFKQQRSCLAANSNYLPVPCCPGSCTLKVTCICWKDQGIQVMLHGLTHNWEVAFLGIYSVGRAGIRGFICFPLETNARRSPCVSSGLAQQSAQHPRYTWNKLCLLRHWSAVIAWQAVETQGQARLCKPS